MTDTQLRDQAVALLKKTTVGYINSHWAPPPPANTNWHPALELLGQISPSNSAHVQAALTQLKETVVGYINKNWTTPPAGTHWANALEQLDQIVSPAPPPGDALTGTHWPPSSAFKTIKGIGYGFGVVTVNPGDLASLKTILDAADAAGIKLILGLYPYPYTGTPGDPASMAITAAGQASLQAMNERASSILALYVFNEPYWTNPLTGATSSCGNFTAADLRALRLLIQDIYPGAKVYHDIGSPSEWAPGGSFHASYPCIGDKYADQTGVCDYVGCWDYPFGTNSDAQARSIASMERECAFAAEKMDAVPVWLGQTCSSPPDNLIMPTAAQLSAYNAALRAALPAGALISWYVWEQGIYPDYLSNHPELWPLTV